jgi:hypothetical protein
MNDRKNSEGAEREPQAPKFMRPRRPVLDEPLDGEKQDPQAEPVKEGRIPEKSSKPEPSELDPTQKHQLAPKDLDEAEPKEVESQPASPYFPRGIYEDAWSVEAYYGRGEKGDEGQKRIEEENVEADACFHPFTHWWIVTLTVLLILALLLLTLTEGIPLNLF